MARKFYHRNNTPFSHLLIPRIQEILGVSGNKMKEVLGDKEGPMHDQSWSYLRNGAKIQPYIIERLMTYLTLEQFAALKAMLIKDKVEELNKGNETNE